MCVCGGAEEKGLFVRTPGAAEFCESSSNGAPASQMCAGQGGGETLLSAKQRAEGRKETSSDPVEDVNERGFALSRAVQPILGIAEKCCIA